MQNTMTNATRMRGGLIAASFIAFLFLCSPVIIASFVQKSPVTITAAHRRRRHKNHTKRIRRRLVAGKDFKNERDSVDTIEALPVDLFETLANASVLNPSTGRMTRALDGLACSQRQPRNPSQAAALSFLQSTTNNNNINKSKSLVVVGAQLGDFCTFEYAEQLAAVQSDLDAAGMDFRFIAIGNEPSARRSAQFTGLPLDKIRVDPTASLHAALGLHQGPNWDIPNWVPEPLLTWLCEYTGAAAEDTTISHDEKMAVARAWLNYMAMCAGIAAPDTLPEILRGYIGDKSAPERFASNEVVTVGNKNKIVIQGTTNVKLGPIEYESLWKNEKGYQRPAELATVRLRGMVEVLTNFDEYVPDQRHLAWRGATFLLGIQEKDKDNTMSPQLLYSHRDTGVLAYSKSMERPLSFLEPYIGPKALNPLGLGDRSLEMPFPKKAR